MRNLADNKTAYIPLQHDDQGNYLGVPLGSLVYTFRSACGLMYVDGNELKKVAHETHPIDSKTGKDYIFIGTKDIDINRQYFVDYRMGKLSDSIHV